MSDHLYPEKQLTTSVQCCFKSFLLSNTKSFFSTVHSLIISHEPFTGDHYTMNYPDREALSKVIPYEDCILRTHHLEMPVPSSISGLIWVRQMCKGRLIARLYPLPLSGVTVAPIPLENPQRRLCQHLCCRMRVFSPGSHISEHNNLRFLSAGTVARCYGRFCSIVLACP